MWILLVCLSAWAKIVALALSMAAEIARPHKSTYQGSPGSQKKGSLDISGVWPIDGGILSQLTLLWLSMWQ